MNTPGCTIKSLPPRLHGLAAEVAIRIHRGNAPGRPEPQRIGLLTTNYWGPTPRALTVGFLEPTPADLAARILSHMNAWSCCVSFVQTSGPATVRISLVGSGYWSYLGTDILHVPANLPTMNLQDFTMETPESEFHRVVRHETGHTMGFPHEHMRRDLVARIDPAKAYQYFGITQGWSPQMVAQQVLSPLDESSIFGPVVDETSIMCYQLPGSITLDGQPIAGGFDINANDRALASLVYPVPGVAASLATHDEHHWPAAHDVAVDVAMWA